MRPLSTSFPLPPTTFSDTSNPHSALSRPHSCQFVMRFEIPIIDANNQTHGSPPNNGGGTYMMKRTIDVGPTVSTIVAMLYLGVWIAGVFLCCCCLGRSRRIRTVFVWKGLGMEVDNLKDHPTSEEACNGPPGVHGEVPKKVSMPVEHDPWAMAISRLHQKPPKNKGKGKGKNKSSDYNHDHHRAPAPTSPQISLFPINEESMSSRMPTGGSKPIPHDHTHDAKPTLPTRLPRTGAQSDFINLSTMNHLTDTNSHLHNQTPPSPLFPSNDTYDVYGAPVRRLANATTTHRSPRLDSPLTADSDISRQLQTPSLDAIPLSPRLNATSPPPHGVFTLTADSMSDTQ